MTSSLSEMTKARSERRDKKMVAEVDRFSKIHEDVDAVIDELNKRWEQTTVAILQGRLKAAELSMKECLGVLNSLRVSTESKRLNWDRWAIHTNELQKRIDRFRDFIGLPRNERESLLAKEDKSKEEEEICVAYLNYQALFKIEALLDEVETDIQKGDKVAVREKMIACRTLVNNNIHCPYKKSLMRDYRDQIKKKCDRAQVMLDGQAKPKYLIDDKYMRYDAAVLYLMKKLESLRSVYDSGDYYEGMWQLIIIEKGIKELPDNAETEMLRQHYEYWGAVFGELEQ